MVKNANLMKSGFTIELDQKELPEEIEKSAHVKVENNISLDDKDKRCLISEKDLWLQERMENIKQFIRNIDINEL